MKQLTSADIARERSALEHWVRDMYCLYGRDPLGKQEFLHQAWEDIARLVHINKDNPLVRQSVREFPDLIPRGYTILTILYGAYTAPPQRMALLKDFVAMLGSDLVEEELRVWEYAKKAKEGMYFPELVQLKNSIHEIYESDRFNHDALPPRPYHGYAMLVLNNFDLLGKQMSAEELFGYLSTGDTLMKRALRLTHRTLSTEPIENSEDEVVARLSPPTKKEPDGKVDFYIRRRKLP